MPRGLSSGRGVFHLEAIRLLADVVNLFTVNLQANRTAGPRRGLPGEEEGEGSE